MLVLHRWVKVAGLAVAVATGLSASRAEAQSPAGRLEAGIHLAGTGFWSHNFRFSVGVGGRF